MSKRIILVQEPSSYIHPFLRYNIFCAYTLPTRILGKARHFDRKVYHFLCVIFDRKFSATMLLKSLNNSGSTQPFSTEQMPFHSEFDVE